MIVFKLVFVFINSFDILIFIGARINVTRRMNKFFLTSLTTTIVPSICLSIPFRTRIGIGQDWFMVTSNPDKHPSHPRKNLRIRFEPKTFNLKLHLIFIFMLFYQNETICTNSYLLVFTDIMLSNTQIEVYKILCFGTDLVYPKRTRFTRAAEYTWVPQEKGNGTRN